MQLRLLSKKSLYKELRSSIGYYDARRVIRYLERSELADLDDIERVLNQAGFDSRHVSLTLDIARRIPVMLVDELSRV